MEMIKRRLLPVVALLILLAAACGDSGAEPTPSRPEGHLLLRAQQAFGTVSAGNWEAVYQYVSPRAKEFCTAEEHPSRVINYVGIVRGLGGLTEDAPINLRPIVQAVTDNVGIVAINFLSNGTRLVIREDEQFRWVHIDGEWWLENEDWEVGCAGWKLFEQKR